MIKSFIYIFLILISFSFAYSIPIDGMVETAAIAEQTESSSETALYVAEIESCNSEKLSLENNFLELENKISMLELNTSNCDFSNVAVENTTSSNNVFYIIIVFMLFLIALLSYWVWALKNE